MDIDPGEGTSSGTTTASTSPRCVFSRNVPKGPWTLQIKDFPEEFCDSTLRDYAKAKNPETQSLKGYERGLGYVTSQKVHSLLIHYGDEICVKGTVEPSYKILKKNEKGRHNVHLFLNLRAVVLGGKCSCKAGADGACGHIFALLWKIWLDKNEGKTSIDIRQLSCTDQLQKWGVPNREPQKNTRKFVDLIFRKSIPNKRARNIVFIKNRREKRKEINAKVTSGMLKELHDDFQASNLNSCFAAILKDCNFEPVPISEESDGTFVDNCEIEERNLCLPIGVLWEAEYRQHLGTRIHKFDYLRCTLEECQELESKTLDQSECPLWLEIKPHSFSASNFGRLVKRRLNITMAFLKSLLPSSFKGNRYTRLGLLNEETASAKYLSLPAHKGSKLYRAGFCRNPGIPVLGASCDRIVEEEDGTWGILEIKTLARAKLQNYTLKQAIKEKAAPWLYIDSIDNVQVKPDCHFIYQINGQMALTKLPWCDLLVDCGLEFHVQRFYFDRKLWVDVMLPKLLAFCEEYMPLSEVN